MIDLFMSKARHQEIGDGDTGTTQNSAPRWLQLRAPVWLALLLLVIVFAPAGIAGLWATLGSRRRRSAAH